VESIVHSIEAITALLLRGLAPITDNRDAVVDLGFDRAYPEIRRGYESTIWERSVERLREPDGRRTATRERLYLVGEDS
jgi:hypothetical protein